MSDQCGSGCGGDSCSGCGGSTPTPEEERVSAALASIGNVILVMSGKGGVGKSTVAANLAVSLSLEGKRVGLLDVDFHGPSIPVILGLTDQQVVNDGQYMMPVELGGLKVMSLGFLVQDKSAAVIWRGPMKMGVIQQLIGDVLWGELDYLIIDSPPGTGDEPLSVCQIVPDASGAIIVTTPQEVAISDVRRSVSFCHQLSMPVLGIIENMSGFVCPGCGEVTEIFKTGGGQLLAQEMEVPFMCKIPLDPDVAKAGDDGRSYVYHYSKTETASRFAEAVQLLLMLDGRVQQEDDDKTLENNNKDKGESSMKFAIPLAAGKLCMHFGHCEKFALVEVDGTNTITNTTESNPPPHEPGVLPKWLKEQNVDVVIAGGMGSRAQSLFADAGVKVVTGASADSAESLVKAYLDDSLQTGDNACDH